MNAPVRTPDALLLVSFGGPEGPDDVLPFMENVTRGRNVPRERLVEVSAHYDLFGGRSPINDQNRALMAALSDELRRRGRTLPIHWGNRNWHPFLAEALTEMAAAGVGHAVALVTSAFSSYSGCRQYRENLAAAAAEVAGAPSIDVIRPYWDHPGFVDAVEARVADALARFDGAGAVRLVFTAHSIPQSMADGCDYEAQLAEVAALVAARLGPHAGHEVAYQSRSGPPQVPWLEPDICDRLRELHTEGVDQVVVMPVGFVSDHMEVVYDLDTEARAVADELGMRMVRAATVGTHPAFVAGLADLVEERWADRPARQSVAAAGPRPEPCADGCCPAPRRPGS